MSVELAVNLDKNGVFYAGETLSCELTFSHPHRRPLPAERRDSLTNSSRPPTRRSSLTSQASSMAQHGMMGGGGTDGATTPATSVANSPAPSIIDSMPSPRNSVDERTSDVSNTFGARTARSARPARGRCMVTTTVAPVTLLWGFAQVVGSFVLDDSLVRTDAFAGLNTRGMYQAAGVGGMIGGFGGGTLGITPAMTSLPLFTTPPSIVFCDLTLQSGQSKTCK
ncbi:hypothetical protein THASP1DRAFT_18926 [Thamnocephalis sphaerospora]|uniref:Uncharacterized protein n=1 Tax=Thamnocephalis sphaerospora TaxID=78915 RepID=A0A4P9XJW8_9FUNG|nr:hypothetical protein THASP1DRAFT_18926 [Thamnocephalis sphaerospora]|eukprot:RKP06087.1 hypothetical protein THASP1DRAFT_18926 [Thamnocephalis sphaerospora]